MGKIKKTTTGMGYLKRSKDNSLESETANYTFRFNKKLMKAFKIKCEKHNVNMTDVLLETIKDVVNNN